MPKNNYTLYITKYAKNSDRIGVFRMILKITMVGMTGFEPATSASRTQRATNCATSRKFVTKLIIATKACFVKCFFKFTSYFVFKYHSSCLILFFDHRPGGCRAGEILQSISSGPEATSGGSESIQSRNRFFPGKDCKENEQSHNAQYDGQEVTADITAAVIIEESINDGIQNTADSSNGG